VPVVIKGIDNTWLDVELVIDTGANLVVLPESMIDSLQLEKDQMKTSQLQTVNGKVTAYVGKLPAIEVANEMVEGIDVAFVKDGLMGDSGLLGMSFLGLFRFSIDDELEQMMLIRK
jgi:clan AA aspartic protease (TIGR02281 family)